MTLMAVSWSTLGASAVTRSAATASYQMSPFGFGSPAATPAQTTVATTVAYEQAVTQDHNRTKFGENDACFALTEAVHAPVQVCFSKVRADG